MTNDINDLWNLLGYQRINHLCGDLDQNAMFYIKIGRALPSPIVKMRFSSAKYCYDTVFGPLGKDLAAMWLESENPRLGYRSPMSIFAQASEPDDPAFEEVMAAADECADRHRDLYVL